MRPLALILALGAALPAWGQTGAGPSAPVAPPTQACLSGATALSRGWHDYKVTTINGQDTYAGKAIDCTGFSISYPAGTALCTVLGTACPAAAAPSPASRSIPPPAA